MTLAAGKPGIAQPHARVLSRRYWLLLALSGLPLIALMIGLFAYQFHAQREVQLRELERNVIERRLAVESVVKAASDHVRQLRHAAEAHGSGAAPSSPSPLRAYLARDVRESGVDGVFLDKIGGTPLEAAGANLLGRGDLLERRAGDPSDIDLALGLAPQMDLAQMVTPYLRWSYFFSAAEDFVMIAPFVPSRAVVEDTGFRSTPALLSAWFDYDLYREAAPMRNPDRGVIWTSPYRDAGGAGWMVSHTAPVHAGDRFLGVVGTDVLLSALSDTLAAVGPPPGRLAIVDHRGDVLAQTGETDGPSERPPTLAKTLPATLNPIDPKQLLAASDRIRYVADHYVMAQAIANAPWTLLYVAPRREVNALILPRFVPYGIVLAGLVLTLAAAQLLLRRFFVQPAIALVDHIHAETLGRPKPMPRLPYAWQPWIGAITDAFEQRKDAERALRASDERYRAVVELQTEFVDRVQPDGRLTFANEAYCRFMDIDRDEAMRTGWSVLTNLDAEERAAVLASWARLTPDHPIASIERQSISLDGSVRWVQWTDRGVFDGEGRLVEIQGVGREITERVLAEQAVREREERFRAIAEGVPLPLIISRPDEPVVLFANSRACETFGIKAGNFDLGTIYAEPSDRARLLAEVAQAGGTNGFEVRLRRSDCSVFWALLSVRALGYEGRPALMSVVTDISEHREMEEALRESAQKFRRFAEAHPVPLAVLRLNDGSFIFASLRCSELLGVPHGSLAGEPIARFDADPTTAAALLKGLQDSRGLNGLELRLRAADGKTFFAGLDARVIEFEGEAAAIVAITDLTDRKRAEEEIERQREALYQSEKMAALGSLLAGVAHELNNPLAVVIIQAALLLETASDPRTAARAQKIQAAAERCDRTVKSFLAIARQKPPVHAPVAVKELVQTAVDLTIYGLRSSGVAVDIDLGPDLPKVWGDADQLGQVLINLIVNAQQALQDTAGDRRLVITARREGSKHVQLTIADNGPGVPAENRPRIFDPFFTTKPAGIGTGIGLALCLGTVAAHGGTLHLEDTPGGGATFLIRVPAAAGEVALAERGPDADPPDVENLRILVVDDEPDIAALLAEVVGPLAHRVDTAENGVVALARVAENSYDLVISDLRMPELDGPGLYRRLRQDSFDGPILFISGDTLAPNLRRFLDETGAPFLEKPFSPAEVKRRIREVMNGRAAPPLSAP